MKTLNKLNNLGLSVVVFCIVMVGILVGSSITYFVNNSNKKQNDEANIKAGIYIGAKAAGNRVFADSTSEVRDIFIEITFRDGLGILESTRNNKKSSEIFDSIIEGFKD